MTGYGRAESTEEEKKVVVEMRSLNHRYLEVSLRLPNLFLPWRWRSREKSVSIFSGDGSMSALRWIQTSGPKW